MFEDPRIAPYKIKAALPRETKQAKTLREAIVFYIEKRLYPIVKACQMDIDENSRPKISWGSATEGILKGVVYRQNFLNANKDVIAGLEHVLASNETPSVEDVEFVGKVMLVMLGADMQSENPVPGKLSALATAYFEIEELCSFWRTKG